MRSNLHDYETLVEDYRAQVRTFTYCEESVTPHLIKEPFGWTQCHVDLSLGRPPNDQWKRRSGRPRERWIDQVRKDNGIPPADLWRRATTRGHQGATLWPSLATR